MGVVEGMSSPHLVKYISDTQLEIKGRIFTEVEEIGRGKSAISYLYSSGPSLHCSNSELLTVKKYIKTARNQIPFEQALSFEVLSYQRICQAKVPCPELIAFDEGLLVLVKTYIPGKPLIEAVANNAVPESVFMQMFEMERQLKQAGFHVDYFPANFIVHQEQIYCIDYEAHHYNAEWDFTHWGIFYWLNSEGIARYMLDGQHHHISKANSFKPWDEPFMHRRNELIARYNKLN